MSSITTIKIFLEFFYRDTFFLKKSTSYLFNKKKIILFIFCHLNKIFLNLILNIYVIWILNENSNWEKRKRTRTRVTSLTPLLYTFLYLQWYIDTRSCKLSCYAKYVPACALKSCFLNLKCTYVLSFKRGILWRVR